MIPIPFQTIDRNSIAVTEHPGDTGKALWRTLQYEGFRIRLVEYSANYSANHWCQKGHLVYCLEGTFMSELQTGEKFTLRKGDMYVVSDDMSSHRSTSADGVKLLIIDGRFLNNEWFDQAHHK